MTVSAKHPEPHMAPGAFLLAYFAYWKRSIRNSV